MEATTAAAEPFGSVLRDLRPWIPRSLLDGAPWEAVRKRVGELPEEAAARFGLELRLGNPDPAADTFIPVAPGDEIAEHYVRRGQTAKVGSPQAALARCLVDLADPESFLRRAICGLVLEYDIAEPPLPGGLDPAPGVFLKLRLGSGPGGSARPAPARHLAATLARAVGREESRYERRAVERAFDALGPGAEVLHAGALPGRGPRAVRLVAQRIREQEIPAVLQRLGWTGPLSAVTRIFTDLRSVSRGFRLSFDVAARGVAPRLGLEMYRVGDQRHAAEGEWTTTVRGDWLPFVARLRETGWCLPAKAEGLAAWPVLRKVWYGRRPFLVYRGINHVKMTIEEDGAAHAKAYVGMHFAPVTPRPGTRETSGPHG